MKSRIIDANLNRFREGIRVVEDIFRYLLNDKELSSQLKTLRHIRVEIPIEILLQNRDVVNDVLKSSTKSEQTRENLKSIVIANFKRAQESARVLEELLKTENIESSEDFKKARYSLYNIEKLSFEKYDFKL